MTIDDEFILEDAEFVEELSDEDLLDDDDDFIVSPAQPEMAENDPRLEEKNPLATVTLAELYVSQGFTKRAFTIYRQLIELDPHNTDLKKRLYELKKAIDDDTATARYSHLAGGAGISGEVAAGTSETATLNGGEPPAPELVVQKLEQWLDAIQRRR